MRPIVGRQPDRGNALRRQYAGLAVVQSFECCSCGVEVLLSEVQCSCAVLSASTDNAGAVLVMEVLEVVDARHDTGRDLEGVRAAATTLYLSAGGRRSRREVWRGWYISAGWWAAFVGSIEVHTVGRFKQQVKREVRHGAARLSNRLDG